MCTQTAAPSCMGLFDPTAPECASCTLVSECVREQENRLASLIEESPLQETEQTSKPKNNGSRKKAECKETNVAKAGDAQLIRKHTRQRLEIPPIGVHLQAVYKGKTYEALVVADSTNSQSGGRSVLFNGETYQTLTAAAHAIAPGIHSGSVWRAV